MAATVKSSGPKPTQKTEFVDSGVWAPTALYLRCACCQTEGMVPNPEHKSLMMLVIEAENMLNWYIPMGGGPVLCPICHRREANRVGVESFLVAPVFTHRVDSKGNVRIGGS